MIVCARTEMPKQKGKIASLQMNYMVIFLKILWIVENPVNFLDKMVLSRFCIFIKDKNEILLSSEVILRLGVICLCFWDGELFWGSELAMWAIKGYTK